MIMRNFILKFIFFLLISLTSLLVFAWDQPLINWAKEFAESKTPETFDAQKQAYIFSKNAELNSMAGTGKINNDVYQKNQSNFQRLNDGFSKSAAQKAGLTIQKQVSAGSNFKAWTDTDNLVGKSSGKVNLQDIKNVRVQYNAEVSSYLEQNKIKNAGNVDWAKRTDTDFMAKTTQTNQFQAISKWINKMGGTAYESSDAARVEQLMRDQNFSRISLNSAKAYNFEMNQQIEHKLKLIDKTNALSERIKATNPKPGSIRLERLEKLQANTQKLSHQIAKYLVRKEQINTVVSDNFSTGNKFQMPDSVKNAAATRASETAADAIKAANDARNLIKQSDANFNNTVKNVSKLTELKDNIRITRIEYSSQIRRAVTAPDRFTKNLINYKRPAPNSFGRQMEGYGQTALKVGGVILMAFKFYDIGMEAYRTGNYLQGAVNLAVMYGLAKGGEYLVTSLFGSFFAANPVTATAIGTFVVSYGLTREIFSRVEVGGKSLDQHTQDLMDKYYFKSGQYDDEAKKQLIKMYFDALAKGHKLQNGMTPEQGLELLLKYYDSNTPIFRNIFEQRGAIYTNTTVDNSTIINTVSGTSEASGKSQINTGIEAVSAKVQDSYIENKSDVQAVAKDNSKINTGVSLNQSTVQQSFISTRTAGKVSAQNNSTINTGLLANKSEIKNATITSDVQGNFTAKDNANINAGVQANNTRISNSSVSNVVQGANTTANRSTINQGAKFDKDANETEPQLQFNFGK